MHIVHRGVDRAPCFVVEDDYEFYKDVLRRASASADCAIHAYVLMTNHAHLLVTPRYPTSSASLMKSIGVRYVRYFNDRYGRTGTLWEGRHHSALVDSGHYLLGCSRYIEWNPVRAGMVACAEEYPWSSYRCNALGTRDTIITPHATYRALGAGPHARRAAYRALFAQPEEAVDTDAIRCALAAGTVLGDVRFREEVERLLERRLTRMAHGGDRHSRQFRAARSLSP